MADLRVFYYRPAIRHFGYSENATLASGRLRYKIYENLSGKERLC
jgi:hypothetical protein